MFKLGDIVNSGLLKDNIYVSNNKGELTHKGINANDTWILKHMDILVQTFTYRDGFSLIILS